MKNKPTSHKNQNTFHFLTFAERLSNINIDVIRKVKRTTDDAEDANTFFEEAIEKWNDLNYTEDYVALVKEIGPEIRSLSQIVLRLDEIVEILLKHLKKSENLAMGAILELVVALARDLQMDFYNPYFTKFFMAIAEHLHTKDTDLLEKIFICYSYLFKFLWKYMVKDMQNVYRLFTALTKTDKVYIRNFAAESFAFLIRKVPNKEALFNHIFFELMSNSTQWEGVGQLLFETVKGVKKRFHTCAQEVLQHVLTFLGEGLKSGQNHVYKNDRRTFEWALVHMLKSMAKHTSKEHGLFVQTTLCRVISQLLTNLQTGEVAPDTVIRHLNYVLHLLMFWVKYHDGMLMVTDEEIIKVLSDLSQSTGLPESCFESIIEIISSVFLSSCIQVPVECISSIISSMYSHPSRNLIFQFTRKMFSYGMFEKDVLPCLLTHCVTALEDEVQTDDVLEIMTDVVTNLRPLIKSGEGIQHFSKLHLCSQFSRKGNQKETNSNSKVVPVLENLITTTLSRGYHDVSDLPKLWCALTCLPHLRFLEETFDTSTVEHVAKSLYTLLMEPLASGNVEIISFVLCQAVISWVLLNSTKEVCQSFPHQFYVDLLIKYPTCVSILRMTEVFLYYTVTVKKVDAPNDMVIAILPHLVFNLASPFHSIRLFTLQILCAFDLPLPHLENEVVAEQSVFSICLEAEKVPISIQNYREKLKMLQKLQYPFVKKNIPTISDVQCLQAPIYYLLGTLYINFRLLWQPALNLFESFAHGMKKSFWEVFNPYLQKLSDLTELISKGENDISDPLAKVCEQSSVKMDLFHNCMMLLCKHSEIPDTLNHRELLWKAMALFPDVVEPRNKDIVPLLFRFVKNEVAKVDYSLLSSETVNKVSGCEVVNGKDDDDMSDDEVECNNLECKIITSTEGKETFEKAADIKFLEDEKYETEEMDDVDAGRVSSTETSAKDEISDSSESRESRIKKRKCLNKTLATYLSLFTKFKNPKAFYRTEELQILYYELLSYNEAGIQKLSFDCIMTYNYKYLVPYKENFYNILDDPSFKTEVVLFSLDEANGIIEEEHRMKLMPVLMRILYGKMLCKTGNNTAGRSQAHTRRSIVLRFLAGCRAEELKLFLDLAFAPFKELVESGSMLSIVKDIRTNIDLSSVVPIRKQHSALNTLGTVLKHLGSLVPELLPWLLKILVIITATSSALLERRNEVLAHCVARLKSVRTLSVDKLIQFFTSFNRYPFSGEEIDAIFEAIVWPMLPRFEFEALHQPPPLLRLFIAWSENSRYFVLFAKHHEISKSLSPLPHLMSLYTAAKAQLRVVGQISKMLEHLLTLCDFTSVAEGKNIPEIKINFCLPVIKPRTYDGEDLPSYGTMLLVPHTSMILKRLRATVMKAANNPKMSLNSCDLNILLKISEYVDDPEQSSELIEILIPFFMKPKRLSEDAETGILSTINNLMKNVDQPKKFIGSLCPLFSSLYYQRSRVSLVEVFKTMAIKEKSLQCVSDIVTKINAWDPSRMEEPDYQTRLDGQSLAAEMIRKMLGSIVEDDHVPAGEIMNRIPVDIDENFIQIIIFNSSYMIRLCEDFSLRDSGSYMLQQLAKNLSQIMDKCPETFKVLTFDTLLPEVQKGLKNKTETARHEFIRVLGSVLHHCGSHPRLQSLALLCDKDQEMDFWQNVVHVQVHRRARALLRFSDHLSSGELSINHHLIVTYITPIVTSFLFDATYKKHIHVVDAAVETIGSVAKMLPWSRYEPMLRYYLNQLSKFPEHHKTVVKVVVAILNAFHFDLSASRGIQSNLKEPPLKKRKVALESNEVTKLSDECEPIDVRETTEISKDEQETEAEIKSYAVSEEKATKIHHIIAKSILPQLHRSLTDKTRSDQEHKLAGHYRPEDDEILRVPIALAMVKLMQNLPHDSLKVNLPGLFLKMCGFLKSRAESIRETARETLIKMMQSLGPSFFWYLLREMKGVLKKGYQVHVMIYTVNAILGKLKDQLANGDLDLCVLSLSEVCNNDLFGNIAEEKEVSQITGKLKEARSSRSYTLYQIMGQFISEEYLLKLIQPLKQVISNTHSHKTVKKVHDCLRHIVEGLSENSGISPGYLLKFIQETISESISPLDIGRNSKPIERAKELKFVRPDIFIIPKEPPRGGMKAKTSIKTNDHVLVEFGLQLLHRFTKKEKATLSSEEHCEVLNQFVPDLADCLESNYIKIISTALRCLMWLYKFPLPALKSNTERIINSLFVLLNKYADKGTGCGDNFELVVMCFKMFTILVHDTDYHKWTNDQIKALLSYVEQDIYSSNRQATAFNLLKAILYKKIQTPELPGIMDKVTELSINSQQEHIQAQCRQAVLLYLLDYALGKKIQDKLSFYVTQLEYFYESGRVSAIEMINSVLNNFKLDAVKKYSGLFFIPVAARLVNDEAGSCRERAAKTIKNLLKKIDYDERNNLFSIASTWLQSKKMSHRRLGAQLCGIFAEVECDKFERHLDDILPIIAKQIEDAKSADIESFADERCTDHFLYHLLAALTKTLSKSVIRSGNYTEKLNAIWEILQKLILHPHLWVRHATAELFGILFGSYKEDHEVDEVLEAVVECENSEKPREIFFASRQKLRDLSADFATQFQSPHLNTHMGEQIMKNLVYLARVISRLPQSDAEWNKMDVTKSFAGEEEEGGGGENAAVDAQPTVTLNWMIRRVSREVKKEVSETPRHTVKRECAFKFLTAVALDLGAAKLLPMIGEFLRPLCRELADSSAVDDSEVKKLAQNVIKILREIVGIEVFTREYATAQSAVFKRKAKRKHDKAMEAVTDPQAYARKRIKKQQSKKKVKKRKIMSRKK